MTSRTSTSSLASADSLSPQDGRDSAPSPSVKSSRSARKSSRQGSGLIPTPRAQDSYERSNWKTVVRANEGTAQMTLSRKIRGSGLLPTPDAFNDPHSGGSRPGQSSWEESKQQIHLHHFIALSSSPTSSPSTAPDSEEQLCLPGASPASLSVTPGSDEARKMTVQSGLKCLESSTRQGPPGLLERMLAASSAWNSTKCLLTWKWKATPQGRSILELSASTPRTAGCESGLSDTIPTPATRDYKGGCESNPYDTLDSLVETGATKNGDGKKTGLKLQPAFVEWMMGYPLGFTHVESQDSKPSATPSSLPSRSKSSRQSRK